MVLFLIITKWIWCVNPTKQSAKAKLKSITIVTWRSGTLGSKLVLLSLPVHIICYKLGEKLEIPKNLPLKETECSFAGLAIQARHVSCNIICMSKCYADPGNL